MQRSRAIIATFIVELGDTVMPRSHRCNPTGRYRSRASKPGLIQSLNTFGMWSHIPLQRSDLSRRCGGVFGAGPHAIVYLTGIIGIRRSQCSVGVTSADDCGPIDNSYRSIACAGEWSDGCVAACACVHVATWLKKIAKQAHV